MSTTELPPDVALELDAVHAAVPARHDRALLASLDRDDAEVIEARLYWGQTLLGVRHVAMTESLDVATAFASIEGVDDVKVIGARLHVPMGTRVQRQRASDPATDLFESELTISTDERLVVTLTTPESGTPLTLELSRLPAPTPTPRGAVFQRGLMGIGLASLLLHGALTTAMSLAPGANLDDSDESLDRSTLATLTSMTANAAEHERAQEETQTAAKESEIGGQTGGAHRGESGQAGAMIAKQVAGAYAIKGAPDSTEVHLQKIRTMIADNSYGALGALNAALVSTNTPIDPDSAFAEAAGRDPLDADGHIAGDFLGDAFGQTSLGMYGGGPGGGGFFDTLGTDQIGRFGHDRGEGGPGFGGCTGDRPCGAVGRVHPTKGVKIIETESDITGGLPREVVQRIVRANFPRLRACYD
ncbi:MAG: hypothetical protein ACHREM_20515, partial [Polyangiales bacterium]